MRGGSDTSAPVALRRGARTRSPSPRRAGGTIARQLAIVDADRVEKLVAIGTEIPHHRPPYIQLFQLLSYLPGADYGFRKNMSSERFLRSSRGFGGCFANRDLIVGEFQRLFVQPLLDHAELRLGQRRRLRGIDWKLLDSLAEGHARIRGPVLLIWGADDPVFPIDEARKMVPQFKSAQLVAIPDAKLFVHEERPDQVAEACISFLAA